MNREKLRKIVQLAKAQMLINDELMKVIKDDSLDLSDRAILMTMTERGMDNVQEMLQHFNGKYLQTEAV